MTLSGDVPYFRYVRFEEPTFADGRQRLNCERERILGPLPWSWFDRLFAESWHALGVGPDGWVRLGAVVEAEG